MFERHSVTLFYARLSFKNRKIGLGSVIYKPLSISIVQERYGSILDEEKKSFSLCDHMYRYGVGYAYDVLRRWKDAS